MSDDTRKSAVPLQPEDEDALASAVEKLEARAREIAKRDPVGLYEALRRLEQDYAKLGEEEDS